MKKINTKITIEIDKMFQMIHDKRAEYDDDIVTDMTIDDFRESFIDTTQPMLCFLDRNDLRFNSDDTISFDIASFHVIQRELNKLTVEYDNNKCVFLTDPNSLSYKYECTYADHFDYNISYVQYVIDLLTDFYYHEYKY